MPAGLILAAGAGARFGHLPKQLALLAGRPLLQWALDAQCEVPVEILDPIVVVLGAHAAQIRATVDFGRALPVNCPQWASGQAASLRCGLEDLRARQAATKIVVTLGDEPFISAAAIARFAGEPAGTRAVFKGQPGHPVVLGAHEITALSGNAGDHGARDVLRDARTVEIGHVCSGRDVDTPADLEEIRLAAGSRPL